MVEPKFVRPPNFEAKVVNKDEGGIDWHVYCMTCHKIVDHAQNGGMMEATGKVHTNQTGHSTIIGLLVRLEEKV